MVAVSASATGAIAGGGYLGPIVPDGGYQIGSFGFSVAINEDHIVVGAGLDDVQLDPSKSTVSNTGSVYVFDAVTGQLRLNLVLSGGMDNDFFGAAVAIDDDVILVGAPLRFGSGAAYLFDAITGEQLAEIVPDDAEPGDRFGNSVAISESRLIVGSPNKSDVSNFRGSAYIYERDGSRQIANLIPNSIDGHGRFGAAVAISDSAAIVGAPYADAVYFFDSQDGDFHHRISQAVDGEYFRFGYSVDVDGEYVAVGNPRDNDHSIDSGAAYLYDFESGSLINKYKARAPAYQDAFGWTVAIDGDTLLVGARDDDLGQTVDAGSVYLIDIPSGREISIFHAEEIEQEQRFGQSLALHGSIAIVGAQEEDTGRRITGSVYAFDVSVCPDADVNHDRIIDTADLGQVVARFGTAIDPASPIDINNNGVVDTADIGLVLRYFGYGCD